MAKKKASRGPGAGTKIRVRDGISIPEFPDVACGGWTGMVIDVSGKENPQYVVEWDGDALQKMPKAYIDECEQKNLLYTMACLPADSLEFLTPAE
jgi:hypothetical protein